jgi:hypothetical protein
MWAKNLLFLFPASAKMEIDRKFINVLVLGLAFMLIFTAFQTMGNIQVRHAPFYK